ncbi:hypothetical protein ILYODFUR_002221 [Ilyodon furcidens]|uniref:Uncharacterized protein n=1 Tax=Ilyodon furcidens TaxID=33524 RepID=A0ABV0TRK0_9TELE
MIWLQHPVASQAYVCPWPAEHISASEAVEQEREREQGLGSKRMQISEPHHEGRSPSCRGNFSWHAWPMMNVFLDVGSVASKAIGSNAVPRCHNPVLYLHFEPNISAYYLIYVLHIVVFILCGLLNYSIN